MNLCLFIAAVNCDESGTIVAASCNLCPYEFYSDEYWYDYYYNDGTRVGGSNALPGPPAPPPVDGTYCNGDCSWNSDLDECQIKGIFLMTMV